MFSLASVASAAALAQDPAHGWMAYAVGTVPEGTERITRLEMTWKVNSDPARSEAFFSPWFGMDPEDNLNLIQPVNPWVGGQWSAYTEYFQWRPTHNSNSDQEGVRAGQTLHGALIYDKSTDSYELSQTVVETGAKSSQTVRCQFGKKYKLPYVVYEKTFPCRDYPSDGKVTFNIVAMECDGQDCTGSTKWESKVEDANCNMKANIEDQKTISITWDTSLPSKYDNMTSTELLQLNAHGWAANHPAVQKRLATV